MLKKIYLLFADWLYSTMWFEGEDEGNPEKAVAISPRKTVPGRDDIRQK